jgi:hypothetical protein
MRWKAFTCGRPLALAKEELQRTAVEMMHIGHTYSSSEATKAVKRIQETLEKL